MKFNIKKIDASTLDLLVELVADDLKKYIDSAEIQLGKGLTIPGFRKGKIPKDVIRQHVSVEEILSLSMEVAVRDSLASIVKDNNLDVLNVSDLKVKENNAAKLIYAVSLILFPDIKIADLKFKIKKRLPNVTKEELESALDGIRSSRAILTEKNSPAEEGDRLEIDFEVRSGGQVIEGGISKNHPLVLGKKIFVPGFEENLVGMTLGQEKDFYLVAPRDYPQKSIAGKKLGFHVKVQSIKKVDPPKLDDEFAKALGNFRDRGQLIESVKEGLIQEKSEKEKQRIRLEILDKIIQASDITTPQHMVEQQLDSMIDNFDADLHRNGMELGPYLAHMGKTRDDLKKDWRKEAEKQVKTVLVLHKIAKEANITVDGNEVETALGQTLQNLMARGGIQNKEVDTDTLRNNVTADIINEKTLQYLERHYSV